VRSCREVGDTRLDGLVCSCRCPSTLLSQFRDWKEILSVWSWEEGQAGMKVPAQTAPYLSHSLRSSDTIPVRIANV